MGPLGLHLTDCETVLSQIKDEEKQLRLKRRWLMGLPLSLREQKRFEGPEFIKEKTLPESLLREDDVFFETAKSRVEEAFGERSMRSVCSVAPENFEPFDMTKVVRHLRSHLNDLTTRGLYNFALVVTGGSVEVLKTRQYMRKVIKESLPNLLNKHRNVRCNCEMCKQIYQLLCDPHNFRGNNPFFSSQVTQSGKAAVIKLLDRLDEFPFQVLIAMYRKLKGMSVKAPSRCGRSRDHLVRQVRKTAMNMLSNLDEKDILHEPLAKAMTIAVLSLKLISGPQSVCLPGGFCNISAETKALQDDIVKAILHLGSKEFQPQELSMLRRFFDPQGKLPSRYITPSVKKMLTKYLFECCDLDAIPKSILEGVAFINGKSQPVRNSSFSKDELEEEVECIMDLSARTKQITWDCLPENEYHKGFTDAYIEELQESDDDDAIEEDGNENPPESSGTDLLLEGFGESVAVNLGQSPITDVENTFSPLVTSCKVVTPKIESEFYGEVGSISPFSTGPSVLFEDFKLLEGRTGMDIDGTGCMSDLFSPKVSTGDPSTASLSRISTISFKRHKVENDALEDQKQCSSSQISPRDQYLAIQDACDETSMVAYNLVGIMLEQVAEAEGLELDVIERSYLKGEYSVEEAHSVARKKKPSWCEDVKGSVIHRAVEKLIPSLQKSVMEEVEKMMESR